MCTNIEYFGQDSERPPVADTTNSILRSYATIFFYPRDAMLAPVLAMTLCPCLCLSICLLQVGVLSKGMNGLIWFWLGGFFRPVLYTVLRTFRYLQK